MIEEKILNPGPEDHHMHTASFSDGNNSFEAIAQAAWKIGLRTITITDHSDVALDALGIRPNYRGFTQRFIKTLEYMKAKGIGPDWKELEVDFGVEADIEDEEGTICSTIQGKDNDFVILSAHLEGYTGKAKNITQAYIEAIKNNHERISLIGHPDAIYFQDHVDIDTVVEAANAYKIPAELNGVGILQGTTNRELTRRMLDCADRIIVNSDAHMITELRCARHAAFNFLLDEGYISKAFYADVARQNRW